MTAKQAYVIVIGNEKGGSGKTTTCMHLITALLRLGFSVGSIDIDARQRTLSRYIENRRQTVLKQGVALPLPYHIIVNRSPFNLMTEAEEDERNRFAQAMERVYTTNDFVIIDSPGNDTFLSRLAHSFANMVITPINDSFVDLDVLAQVEADSMKVLKPSIYSQMLWEQKLARAKRDGGSIEWVVLRNRLTTIDSKNKRHVSEALKELSRRIGFRLSPGFSERVIFRELFLQGLTVLDVMEQGADVNLSLSHIAARQEVRDLLRGLAHPDVNKRLEEMGGFDEKKAKPAAEKPVEAAAPAPAEPHPVAQEASPSPAPVEPAVEESAAVRPQEPVSAEAVA
ncbi:MAG: AAA family ATPase [Alphaproteobacteria bacterium]|nr:AAA family ATPase [Alphaproteobacteria bacterium]